MKDLIISQVNNKYLRMSLTAHSAGRLVVHNLLEKENSFQVEAQGERDPGGRAAGLCPPGKITREQKESMRPQQSSNIRISQEVISATASAPSTWLRSLRLGFPVLRF